MTHDEICDLFDSNPNLTMQRLSQITGLSVQKLKSILLGKE